jgi:hypothetical protein
MSEKQVKQKSKVTLSKTAKRMAGAFINPHERGAYIRSMLDAENAAFMARFSKPTRDRSDSKSN